MKFKSFKSNSVINNNDHSELHNFSMFLFIAFLIIGTCIRLIGDTSKSETYSDLFFFLSAISLIVWLISKVNLSYSKVINLQKEQINLKHQINSLEQELKSVKNG